MSLNQRLLNKSNSYNYYKSKCSDLSKENEELKEKIKSLEMTKDSSKSDLENLIGRYDEDIKFLKDRICEIEEYNQNVNNELHYAFVFNDTIKDSLWLKRKNFSLIHGAANYSLMYYIFRALDDGKPKNILELGLGQTTKLTSQYVNYYKDAKLTVLEADETWIENFSKNLELGENIEIKCMDIEKFEYNNTENLRFKDFLEVVGDEKYDLIIIDGPQGYIVENGVSRFLDYPRSNVWQLIQNNLAEDFIIIMDDFERQGEQNTMNELKDLLRKNDLEFFEHSCFGMDYQNGIFSQKYRFLSWI